MAFEDGLRVLEGRTKLASLMSWAVVATGALMASGELLEAFGTADTINGTSTIDGLVALSYVLFLLALLGSVITVGMWLHRAHANLHEAGIKDLEFTPGWAVGWYFIPFANLFKPFQAMRELWNVSHAQVASAGGGEAPNVVKTWWGLWIGGNVLSNISSRLIDGSPGGVMAGNLIGAIASVALVGAGLLLIGIMRDVYAAQRGITAAAVFA